ncbi:MAG: acetate--CoA ligase family protein, partial [Rhizobiaceae bacterium]
LGGNSLASLSCSGGEAALMADAGEGRDVEFPQFAAVTTAALKTELGPIVTIANPLDYNTFIWGDWDAMRRIYAAALSAQNDLSMLVLDFPREDICDSADWDHALDGWLAAVKQTGARAAVVATMAENMPEPIAEKLIVAGVTPLCGIENAVVAAEAAASIARAWVKPAPLPLLLRPHACPPHASGEPALVSDGDSSCGEMDSRQGGNDKWELVTLDEHQSKSELAAFGLAVPNCTVIGGGDEIPVHIKPPFALKALGIAHKTEAGAVHLHLLDKAELTNAVSAMSGLSDTFLVEEMAHKPDAELIVGISRDPVAGLMMTIGAGGVLAELLSDTATLLLPFTEAEIRSALSSLKINRILEGWRAREATDIDALIANIICIANYACANADTLEELDVNPLFATQYGSVAVDALIVKRRPQ